MDQPSNTSQSTNTQSSSVKWWAALAGTAIIALLAGAVVEGQFGVLSFVLPSGQQQITETRSELDRSETPPPKEDRVEEERTTPEGFTTYTNHKIGFKIAYPEEWGEVKVERKTGVTYDANNNPVETGHLLRGSFTRNEDINFGSATHDFSLGTDAPLLIGNGYEKFGDTYYLAGLPRSRQEGNNNVRYNGISDRNPKALNPENGILYDHVALGDLGPDGNTEPSGYDAMFNTEEGMYNGVAFRLNSRDESDLGIFKRMLTTFELVESKREQETGS